MAVEDNNPLLADTNSFLGTGWDFPPTFVRGYNGTQMIKDEDDIQSSLEILLSTSLGERVLRPDYGAAVQDLLFEPLDTGTETLLQDRIERAVVVHEPRVFVDNIELTSDRENGIVELKLDYTIVTTNTRSNLVFPFYLNEGTDIQA